MKDNNLIRPIRTRGSIPTRGSEVEDLVPAPVRTRGAIRTRGLAPALTTEARLERTLTFEVWVQDLRAQVGGLPLTLLVHGWGSDEATEFLRSLFPLVHKDDALWLATLWGGPHPPAPAAEGVVLDPSRATDRRLYQTLVADIVFFPASRDDEAAKVGGWSRRARAVVINKRGDYAQACIQAGCEALLMTYGWSGGESLEAYASSRSSAV